MNAVHIVPVDATVTRIMDKGMVKELDYDGAMTLHMGSLWWGTAVGYRAMQAAALALSLDGLWSRDDLYIGSAHPGPGVRDAIDYITDTVDRERYKVFLEDNCGMKCNSSMKFEWWVSDGKRPAFVRLRAGFVARAFYELSDRLGTDAQTDDDSKMFEISKVNLSTRIWATPLERNFTVAASDTPLRAGQLTAAVQRTQL